MMRSSIGFATTDPGSSQSWSTLPFVLMTKAPAPRAPLLHCCKQPTAIRYLLDKQQSILILPFDL